MAETGTSCTTDAGVFTPRTSQAGIFSLTDGIGAVLLDPNCRGGETGGSLIFPPVFRPLPAQPSRS